MKLYYGPGACSLASHILAEEMRLALTYEKVDLKEHKTERGADYFEINPKGYVPALELDDGSLLTENVALLPFLARQKPEAGLVPQDDLEWARLMEWLGYISSELHKSFGPIFRKKSDEAVQEARKTVEKRLRYVDTELDGKPFLLGGRFSPADAYLFVMLLWSNKVGIDLEQFSALASYREKLADRPGFKRAMAAEGLI